MYREWKKIEFPKKVLSMNLETRLRGRPRIRWQDEVTKDGRLLGLGTGWRESIRNREERKKLLRTAGNCRIVHRPMNEMK